jgi:ribosomal protein L2
MQRSYDRVIGGGHKRRYCIIDFNGTVMVFLQQLQPLILIGTLYRVNYQDGEKAYVIAKMVCKRSEHSFWCCPEVGNA